jgi:hypothetical protein
MRPLLAAAALLALAALAPPSRAADCGTIVGWVGVPLCQAAGAGDVTVPNVVGLSLAAADTALMGVGLDTGNVTMQCSNQAANTVLTQNPVASTQVAPASLIDLWASSGTTCKGVLYKELRIQFNLGL